MEALYISDAHTSNALPLQVTTTHELLQTSQIVGNIRFSKPTLYIFPGAQGDCAVFGVHGFNMLLDGG